MPSQDIHPFKDGHIANHSYGNWYIYQSGASTQLWLGSWDWEQYKYDYNFYAHQSRALFQFNMPTMGPEESVISAKLCVPLGSGDALRNANNASSNFPNPTPTIDVHRILQDWDEGTGSGQSEGHQYSGITWTNRKANGYGWNTYGGHFDPNPVASLTMPKSQYMWEFDITNLVKDWMADPSNNFGLLLKYRDERAGTSHWIWGKEIGMKWGPYILLTYNSAPEPPRGLAPNFGGFICQDLAHTMEFKWTFLDTAAPVARGRANICFLIDVSSSMSYMVSHLRNQINAYIDRLNNEGVDWQISFVSYSDVRLGEPINKYGWYTNKNDALFAYDRIPRYDGGDYPESGLEAILDAYNGAKSFTWRNNSERQLVICGDAPFHNRSGVDTYYANYSNYEISDATNWLNSMGIKASAATNTHCGSYTQLRLFPNSTGGQYLDISSNWGDYLNILTYKTANEAARYDEGDYQTRADLRIFRINTDGSRTHIWSYTVNGGAQSLFVKGLGVPWQEGSAYEWDVQVYDRYGVSSPWSTRAPFSYIIDVNAAIGIPMFREPIKIGETVNRKAFDEIKEKLYYEVRKYSNLDPGLTESLFTTDVIPTTSDFSKIQVLVNSMLMSDGLPASRTVMLGSALGVSDVESIRNQITTASMSGPDDPRGGTAKFSPNYRTPPTTIIATNANASDHNLRISWTPAETAGAGWIADLQPVNDTDINYYKVYREEVLNLTNKTKKILTEVYLTAEQVAGGPIFIPQTGRTDGESITYRPHDMNGRTSNLAGNVVLNRSTPGADTSDPISYYQVEYQQRHWSATESNPKGLWYTVYQGRDMAFNHWVGPEGSYWYRVRGISNWGISTGWTYTQNRVYVRN